jgi:REP-associated tyrosine transposase
MSQSLVKNLVHLTFSTKGRALLIKDDVRNQLHKYMKGVFREWDCPAIEINSVEDHAHALFCLSKNIAMKKIVEEVKRSSSRWIKSKGIGYRNFYWQAGYGAFSIGQSAVPTVIRYIENQTSTQGVALGWIRNALRA